MTIDALPRAQARAVVRLLNEYEARGERPVWHLNACGCCVSVHADVPHPRGGYIVGRDGEYNYEVTPHADT